MNKAFLGASLFALAACTTPTTHPIYPSSNVANVYVVVYDKKLYAYPEVVVVKNRNTDIVWHLAGPANYTFDDIEIDDPKGPKGEFDSCTPQTKKGTKASHGYTFTCVSNNNQQGTKPARHYKYKISVTGTPAIPPLDPWVVND